MQGSGSWNTFGRCPYGQPTRGNPIRICGGLTQLVKIRVAAIGPRDRADQAGLQEGRPFVHQAPLAAHVVLIENKYIRPLAGFGSRVHAKAGEASALTLQSWPMRE